MNKEEEHSWLLRLQNKIYQVLQPIIPNDNVRILYVSQEAMAIWAQAFTHVTFDYDFNYESLEFFGDRILYCVVIDYLRRTFANDPPSVPGFAELTRAYTENSFNRKIVREKLQINGFIRIRTLSTTTAGIDSDIYEAFIAALYEVGNMVRAPGVGYLDCFNLIVYILNDIEIDRSQEEGNVGTQVRQIFERMGKGSPTVEIIQLNEVEFPPSGGYRTAIILTQQQMDLLHDYEIDINNPVIAVANRKWKAESDSVAFGEALKLLKSKGITVEWARTERRGLDIVNAIGVENYNAFFEKMDRLGYEIVYCEAPRKASSKVTGERSNVVELIGKVKDMNRHVIIYSEMSVSSEEEEGWRTRLLRRFFEDNILQPFQE